MNLFITFLLQSAVIHVYIYSIYMKNDILSYDYDIKPKSNLSFYAYLFLFSEFSVFVITDFSLFIILNQDASTTVKDAHLIYCVFTKLWKSSKVEWKNIFCVNGH